MWLALIGSCSCGKAKALAIHIYQATDDFPRSETYGLLSQIRRASVSVVSNIAEGQGRLTVGEFQHFLGQARGSLLETETQLAIATDLGYLNKGTLSVLEQESYQVLGLIDRLIDSLRQRKRQTANEAAQVLSLKR